MRIVVVTNIELKAELSAQGLQENADVEWSTDIDTIPVDADAYIDLLFETDRNGRKELLNKTKAGIIVVNDVIETAEDLPAHFIRLNGWPTFLKRSVAEVSSHTENIQSKADTVFNCFNKKTRWVQDIPGFIAARVTSTIINEAYFALEDGVSTRDEIDTAMKLGTNYPYGPFEWSRLIGVKNIYSLLDTLSKKYKRYTASGLLKKEATF
jgi:3-hydroxybutyryl-CoA dehydrogenase